MGGPDSASPHNSEWHKKRRPVAYPCLHEALFVWMKAIEKEVTITGAILQAKAAELFPRLYPGLNETVPHFSNGWLDGWKKSYRVKERKIYGEAESAPISEAEEEMQQIQAELMKYDIADVWNADETAYYWRIQPDRGLSTCQMYGRKKDKARITVLVIVIDDGSEQEPLWINGVAENP